MVVKYPLPEKYADMTVLYALLCSMADRFSVVDADYLFFVIRLPALAAVGEDGAVDQVARTLYLCSGQVTLRRYKGDGILGTCLHALLASVALSHAHGLSHVRDILKGFGPVLGNNGSISIYEHDAVVAVVDAGMDAVEALKRIAAHFMVDCNIVHRSSISHDLSS